MQEQVVSFYYARRVEMKDRSPITTIVLFQFTYIRNHNG